MVICFNFLIFLFVKQNRLFDCYLIQKELLYQTIIVTLLGIFNFSRLRLSSDYAHLVGVENGGWFSLNSQSPNSV